MQNDSKNLRHAEARKVQDATLPQKGVKGHARTRVRTVEKPSRPEQDRKTTLRASELYHFEFSSKLERRKKRKSSWVGRGTRQPLYNKKTNRGRDVRCPATSFEHEDEASNRAKHPDRAEEKVGWPEKKVHKRGERNAGQLHKGTGESPRRFFDPSM